MQELIDRSRYPVDDPGGPRWRELIDEVRRDLGRDGCCVLDGFVPAAALDRLRAESERLAPLAHYAVETVNAYNIAVDADLPTGHPGRRTMTRGNAFVARDRIPASALIQRIHSAPAFHRFVAACFGLDEIHPLDDPLAGLCLNVIPPGREHPWHFDTNELTVSLLTVEPEAGGQFEYCPDIRSATDENLDAVAGVLDGRGHPRLRTLHLRPGDLQLFRGRYSLHRVRPVRGATARQSAIFAYTEQAGVVGSVERTRQLFGRVLPAHTRAARRRARVDQLLD